MPRRGEAEGRAPAGCKGAPWRRPAVLNQNAIVRIWRAFGLKPHLQKNFKLSTDAFFVETVRSIVGLYLNPSEQTRAVVLCVDEKNQVQALDRSQPVLPMRPGQAERRTHDYCRHGTTSLFAARDIATGEVIGRCQSQHRQQEFLRFLDQIERSGRGPEHPSGAGQLRHTQDAQGRSVVPKASALPPALHADEQFVAQSGGTLVCEDHPAAHPARRVQKRR
jgi:hypothetical protein